MGFNELSSFSQIFYFMVSIFARNLFFSKISLLAEVTVNSVFVDFS